MICPTCHRNNPKSSRWAPFSIDDWRKGDLSKGEKVFMPLHDKSQEKYDALLNSDFVCPCRDCIVR